MTDNIAVLDGYTREVFAYSHSGIGELHLLIHPDTLEDERFRAWCCDEQEYLWINGWNFELTDVEKE